MINVLKLKQMTAELLENADQELQEKVKDNQAAVRRMLSTTHEMWLLQVDGTKIGVMGVVNHSLITQSAYVWFVPFVGLRARHAKILRPLFDLWACNYNTIVAQCFDDRAARFAGFFGFEHKNGDVFERIT